MQIMMPVLTISHVLVVMDAVEHFVIKTVIVEQVVNLAVKTVVYVIMEYANVQLATLDLSVLLSLVVVWHHHVKTVVPVIQLQVFVLAQLSIQEQVVKHFWDAFLVEVSLVKMGEHVNLLVLVLV
jgi:hypothetical protein